MSEKVEKIFQLIIEGEKEEVSMTPVSESGEMWKKIVDGFSSLADITSAYCGRVNNNLVIYIKHNVKGFVFYTSSVNKLSWKMIC